MSVTRIAVKQMPDVTNKHLPQWEYLESLGYKKATHVYADEVYETWQQDEGGTFYQLDRGIGTYTAQIGLNLINVIVEKYRIIVTAYIPSVEPRPYVIAELRHHFAVERPVKYLIDER